MARSAAGDRWLVVLIGLVLLLAGVGVTLLSYGVFGAARAGRPLLDPIMVDTVAADPVLWRVIAIAGGIVLAVLGLAWVARSVRPEPRPDVVLDGGPDTTILVSSGAAADAVAAQAGTLPGVGRARARLVGSTAAPALRVTLWLTDDADVRAVLRRLDEEVLATARVRARPACAARGGAAGGGAPAPRTAGRLRAAAVLTPRHTDGPAVAARNPVHLTRPADIRGISPLSRSRRGVLRIPVAVRYAERSGQGAPLWGSRTRSTLLTSCDRRSGMIAAVSLRQLI